jgi:DNA-binding IclR family transcriptional regulator
VLIVLGTLGLAVAIVQRLNAGSEAAALPEHLGQPAGTRIVSVAAAEGMVAVLVARPDGERLLLVSPRTGQVLGALRAAP